MRFPLVVRWLPSRRLLAMGLLIHAAALSGVLFSGLPLAVRASGGLAVFASAVFSARRWRASAGAITLHSLALGEYAPGDGKVTVPVVCTQRTVWSWLIALDLRSVDRSRRWRLVIGDDALPDAEFRRLSVCLRAGALQPARGE